MMDVFTARELIAKQARALAAEALPLCNSHHRIAALDMVAAVDAPPADNSAMDGYALSLPNEAPPWILSISQTVAAGTPPAPLQTGTAARIFTGAEIPAGANAVVLQEECERNGDQVIVKVAARPGDNIRPRAQDIQRGQIIVRRGEKLSALHLGLLASGGIHQVRVMRRPRVALLSSGSELVEPGIPLAPGQIYNSNFYMLRGLLQDWGCELVVQLHVADDLDSTRTALQHAADNSDLIISTGGVSVGDADHLKTAISSLGELELWKVNMKPGKPLAFGRIGKTATPILALPGNPVSAFTTAVIFVKPFIECMYGKPYQSLCFGEAQTAFTIDHPRRRAEFLRVRWEGGRLHPFTNQSSGVLSSLLWADGLAWVAAETTVQNGDLIPYLPLQDFLTL